MMGNRKGSKRVPPAVDAMPQPPRWLKWCPICVRPAQKIIFGLYRVHPAGRTLTFWGCEECQSKAVFPPRVSEGEP